MNTKHRGRITALFLAAALPALIAPLGATDIFRARMLTGDPLLPNFDVQIEVESWTTPEEIRQLQDVLSQSGVNPFLAAFSAMKKGVVRFANRRWNLTIHAAQVLPTEKGKKVMIFLNRQDWDPGGIQEARRYFFMAIELKLNEKGRGEGRFYEDAQIRMDSMLGKIEMETSPSAAKILFQVREVVKKKPGS